MALHEIQDALEPPVPHEAQNPLENVDAARLRVPGKTRLVGLHARNDEVAQALARPTHHRFTRSILLVAPWPRLRLSSCRGLVEVVCGPPAPSAWLAALSLLHRGRRSSHGLEVLQLDPISDATDAAAITAAITAAMTAAGAILTAAILTAASAILAILTAARAILAILTAARAIIGELRRAAGGGRAPVKDGKRRHLCRSIHGAVVLQRQARQQLRQGQALCPALRLQLQRGRAQQVL